MLDFSRDSVEPCASLKESRARWRHQLQSRQLIGTKKTHLVMHCFAIKDCRNVLHKWLMHTFYGDLGLKKFDYYRDENIAVTQS